MGGLQFIKAGEKRHFGGWRDWLLPPGVDWICAIPPSSLGHPGTSNAWASAVSQERVPCRFFLPLIDRALKILIMCRHPQSKPGAAVAGGFYNAGTAAPWAGSSQGRGFPGLSRDSL